ncbi:Lethal (2) giant discs 1 [Strongyloides ratti]|uniref:Lethal (2) giant discs 1 n=1 Tax=Strongyloides ratti TaxID=34506 RepID=A0A090L9S3_STRRB|nr:Lethal (2) giant discs 1 [Strongyloides ratti]CEF66536.1 Lethal (2) giant discs 1 [Strongyloides ratti]
MISKKFLHQKTLKCSGTQTIKSMNFDISNFEANIYGDLNNDKDLEKELKSLGIDEEDDSDCEAELARLMKESGHDIDDNELSSLGHGKNKSEKSVSKRKIQNDDENICSDDETLLDELSQITGEKVKTEVNVNSSTIIDKKIMEKLDIALSFYTKQLNNAKQNGDNAKFRRYQRSIDKIKELQCHVKSGKKINEEDIPPVPRNIEPNEIANKVRKVDESQLLSQGSLTQNLSSKSKEAKLEKIQSLLKERLSQYLDCAQKAKAAGDKDKTMEYVQFVEQFKEALSAINLDNIDDCDPDDIPPPPEPYKAKKAVEPKNLVDDLILRRQFFIEYVKQLEAKGEDRRVRSNQRIIKLYDEAISIAKKGKQPDINELPCPPGMQPISMNYGTSTQTKPSSQSNASSQPKPSSELKKEQPSVPSKRPVSNVSISSDALSNIDFTKLSKQEAQSYFLKRRLQRFKEQALISKQQNDIEKAKEYLKVVKGIEPMIEASENGLPADLRKVPTPPQLNIPNSALKCTIISPEPFFSKIEKTLMKQLAYCLQNLPQIVGQNDPINALIYENLILDTLEDIVLLRKSARANRLPKFQYIEKVLPRAQINMDLDDGTLEFTIHSALNIKPLCGYKENDLCCYMKYEFPFPHNSHQIGTTSVVNYTNSPEYNEKIIFKIARGSRAFQRVVLRGKLKLEIYHKGGFLRSDKLVGNVDVPLSDLEHFATVALKLPILEGRRKTEGTIEVAFRQSKAVGAPKMDNVKEKWLTLVK